MSVKVAAIPWTEVSAPSQTITESQTMTPVQATKTSATAFPALRQHENRARGIVMDPLQLFLLNHKPLRNSCIDSYSIPVITFNLSLTSSKGVALTCISDLYPLFEAQPSDLCVCPAFSALTLSLAATDPF